MTVKFRIQCMASERGGSRDYWTEDFDTLQQAKDRIKWYNDQNTEQMAPDYYEQAQDTVTAVEV